MITLLLGVIGVLSFIFIFGSMFFAVGNLLIGKFETTEEFWGDFWIFYRLHKEYKKLK